jgi:hypothetical protein
MTNEGGEPSVKRLRLRSLRVFTCISKFRKEFRTKIPKVPKFTLGCAVIQSVIFQTTNRTTHKQWPARL